MRAQVASLAAVAGVVVLLFVFIASAALSPRSGDLEFSNPFEARRKPNKRPNDVPMRGARLLDKEAAPASIQPRRRGGSSLPAISRITLANYNKVRPGMTESEVEAILGPGTAQSSSSIDTPGFHSPGVDVQGMSMLASNKVWEHGFKIITITFINGKVHAKAQVGL